MPYILRNFNEQDSLSGHVNNILPDTWGGRYLVVWNCVKIWTTSTYSESLVHFSNIIILTDILKILLGLKINNISKTHIQFFNWKLPFPNCLFIARIFKRVHSIKEMKCFLCNEYCKKSWVISRYRFIKVTIKIYWLHYAHLSRKAEKSLIFVFIGN